jgi:raffinose/stachyose/melibiose transport system permease protein
MAVAIAVTVFYVFPFILVLINPFKDRVEILRNPLALPTELNTTNFVTAFERMDYVTSFLNSLLITVGAGILLVVFPAMLAYYLARYDYRANKLLFAILVISMIVPFQALMIPFVSIYGTLDLLNSKEALMFFYLGFGVALSTFLYHGFVRSLPIALEEAAFLDGASQFRVFWQVVFPMLRPVTATVIILNALWIWNDFLLPSLVLFSGDRTLPLQTFSFFGQFTSDLGLVMAGLVLAATPILIFYMLMQRQVIGGVSQGAVK